MQNEEFCRLSRVRSCFSCKTRSRDHSVGVFVLFSLFSAHFGLAGRLWPVSEVFCPARPETFANSPETFAKPPETFANAPETGAVAEQLNRSTRTGPKRSQSLPKCSQTAPKRSEMGLKRALLQNMSVKPLEGLFRWIFLFFKKTMAAQHICVQNRQIKQVTPK